MPNDPLQPNTYIFENFIFKSATPFAHDLSISTYDLEGRKQSDNDQDAILGEFLPANGQKTQDWSQISELLDGSLQALKQRRLSALSSLFPAEMAEFRPERAVEHYLEQLARLSKITILQEVGCDPKPHRRAAA